MRKVVTYRAISLTLSSVYLLEQLFGIGHSLYNRDLGEGFAGISVSDTWALIAHVYVGYGLLLSTFNINFKVNDGLVGMAAALGLYVVLMY